MEEEGWIEWHPAAGRGKLSQLLFKRSRADVSENLARRYLNEGKIGQAFAVLDQDAAKLTQVIESYLGVQHQEGLQVVRLPYYRQLSMLNPQSRCAALNSILRDRCLADLRVLMKKSNYSLI